MKIALSFVVIAISQLLEASSFPLIEAAKSADIRQIKILLQKSPSSINDHNLQGETALIQVGETGDLETYQILIKSGADINATDSNKNTVLYYAIANGHSELALAILKNPKLRLQSLVGKKSENILFIAAEKGNLAVIQELLSLDSKLALQKNSNGKTASSIAKNFDHKKAAALIDKLSAAK